MKKTKLIIGFLFLSMVMFGQSQMDSLIHAGVQYHDNGEYKLAIETYKRALEIDPNSAMVNYEIAMTYMYAKEYKKSIAYCDKVIDLDDKYLLQAYIAKGSCLDYQGKTKESIKLLKKGIKKFGDHHLLYYNLAYDYYQNNDYDKAQEALINAINTKPDHASSHLLMGYIMSDLNQKVKSLLCLHYFLFLEPGSERSATAFALLKNQFEGNVTKDADDPTHINIMLDPDQMDDEFGAASMMIPMLEASKSLEENEGKSDEEMFIENTKSFFMVLGELKKKKNKGLWWDFYVPFFYALAESENMDTYCYYISQSSNEKAVEWLNGNEKRIEEFAKWLEDN